MNTQNCVAASRERAQTETPERTVMSLGMKIGLLSCHEGGNNLIGAGELLDIRTRHPVPKRITKRISIPCVKVVIKGYRSRHHLDRLLRFAGIEQLDVIYGIDRFHAVKIFALPGVRLLHLAMPILNLDISNNNPAYQ
jgi:hypothetical protein